MRRRGWFALCLAACLLTGCSQTGTGTTDTAAADAESQEQAADSEAETAENSGETAENAGDAEEKGGREASAAEEENVRAVMVNGEIYYDTGLINANMGRCGTLDGNITSVCNSDELPKEDGEANFEGAEGFQNGLEDGTIEIELQDEQEEKSGDEPADEDAEGAAKHWYVFAVESVKEDLLQNALPPYRYSGEDEQEAALITYFLTEQNYYYQSYGSVTIPAFCILSSEDAEDGRIKVYGNFWMFSYVKDGETLSCESGGVTPGAAYLRKEDGGYAVDEFDRIEDGDDYSTELDRICGGNSSLEEQYRASAGGDSEVLKESRLQFINQYVQDNDLDITAYQDYGQDPILLSD